MLERNARGLQNWLQSDTILFLFIVISEVHVGEDWTYISEVKKPRRQKKLRALLGLLLFTPNLTSLQPLQNSPISMKINRKRLFNPLSCFLIYSRSNTVKVVYTADMNFLHLKISFLSSETSLKTLSA